MCEMGCRSLPDSMSRADGAVIIVRLLRKHIDTSASRILGPFGKEICCWLNYFLIAYVQTKLYLRWLFFSIFSCWIYETKIWCSVFVLNNFLCWKMLNENTPRIFALLLLLLFILLTLKLGQYFTINFTCSTDLSYSHRIAQLHNF